jgi:hypothetical protein
MVNDYSGCSYFLAGEVCLPSGARNRAYYRSPTEELPCLPSPVISYSF